MKKFCLFAALAAFLLWPLASFGAMGEMSPKSKDISVQFFGSLKTYPTWMQDLDFGGNNGLDWMVDENGVMSDFNIRNELRMGWVGKGKNFDFLIILESDFNLDKENTDRGAVKNGINAGVLDSGMTGEDFGVEKLDVGYNFGPFRIHTGWNTRFLDIMTGGLVYGDDHPYIGFTGKIGPNVSFELDYTSIYDETGTNTHNLSPFDGDALDWRVYSVKLKYRIPSGMAKGFVISPFYAYSDNNENTTNNAKVSYFGIEAYGKIGMITPRLEVAYANGDTDSYPGVQSYDIDAWAAYASVDINIMPEFVPYFGFRFETGDGDATDGDIDAFNAITDIARYTPTFGMENAIIYRAVLGLGSHLYSGNFNWLPTLNGATTPGYGGIGNSSSGDAGGLIMVGLGVRGKVNKRTYKAQYMHFEMEDTGALEDVLARNVDEEMGDEFDLRVAYSFGKHFTMADCLSVFNPGDGVEDVWGAGYDDTAYINTIELIWKW